MILFKYTPEERPKPFSERNEIRFAWFPTIIGGYYRWLEKYSVVCFYGPSSRCWIERPETRKPCPKI